MKNEWQHIALGDLTAHRPICYGVLKPGERQAVGVPLIRITDITVDDLDESDIYRITPELSSEYKRSVLDGGEVLLSIQGTIGRVAICPPHLKGANISRTIALISPDKRLGRAFLRYWLLSLHGNFPTCGSTRASLNIGALRELKAPVPPLSEQQRIVGILDEAFEGIVTATANAEKNLRNARAILESHLQSVFTQRGKGWVERELGELCEFENGDRGTNYPNKSARTASGIPFINAGHLTDSGLDMETMDFISKARFDLLGSGKVRPKDILFCLRGSLGKYASVGDLPAGAIASSLVIVRPRPTILDRFVLAYFGSPICADMINRFRNGAAQPNLSANSLKKFTIPVPSLAEQERISNELDDLAAETQRLESIYQQKLAALDELKKSLLYQAFTGAL